MDFQQFYAMSYNPFSKSVRVRDALPTANVAQVRSRLDHLLRTGGIGLVMADPGQGKTLAVRAWAESLNRNTTRVVYLCMSTLTTSEFYRQLCFGLGVEPPFKKVDMFRALQSRLLQLADEQNTRVAVVVDEAQFLSTQILRDLVMIANFDMDSRDPFSLVLVGQTYLGTVLSRQAMEPLRQRVGVNYTFSPLTQDDAREYLRSMLRAAGADPELFAPEAAAAAFAACGGSLRRLGAIATNSLIIGAREQARTIDEEMVRAAADECAIA